VACTAVLTGGTLTGLAYIDGGRADPEVWLVGVPLLLILYALVAIATRAAGAAGRGKAAVRVGGIAVVAGGVLWVLVVAADVWDQVRLARPPDMPRLTFAWFPLLLLQSAGGAAAFVAAYPPSHPPRTSDRDDYADPDLPPPRRWYVWVLAGVYLAAIGVLPCVA